MWAQFKIEKIVKFQGKSSSLKHKFKYEWKQKMNTGKHPRHVDKMP